jgi:hypothetical protein
MLGAQRPPLINDGRQGDEGCSTGGATLGSNQAWPGSEEGDVTEQRLGLEGRWRPETGGSNQGGGGGVARSRRRDTGGGGKE